MPLLLTISWKSLEVTFQALFTSRETFMYLPSHCLGRLFKEIHRSHHALLPFLSVL